MLDPFPVPPPRWLVSATKPYADALSLHSLPLHIHEVLFAVALYTTICNIISPILSAGLFPSIYPKLSKRSKLNWDVHVVSFVQSCLINGLSLWVIWCDEERKGWRSTEYWLERIWGYYGSGGLCQSFALGYFFWDLVMCFLHIEIFGRGMLAHAAAAVAVFGLGYRPFIYFSAPVFLLYELSSPFLNIHWFCDKLNLTGSIYQAINGVFLVVTFFSCRLVWGLYSSMWVFRDVIWLLWAGHTNSRLRLGDSGGLQAMTTDQLLEVAKDPIGQLDAFNKEMYIPLWIPFIYLIANLTLNGLNIFWFGKMIETIRTRFDPPLGTKGLHASHKPYATQHSSPDSSETGTPEPDSDLGVGGPGKVKEHEVKKEKGSVRAARKKAEEAMNGPVGVVEDTKIEMVPFADGQAGKSVRSRKKA